MIMKRKLILLAVLSSGLTAFAQELPKVIPPSPTASSLGQYGEVPVGTYTGVPNISVPLYDIRSGEIELPITISYHASGVKVSQEASSVGLGWVLNAGGVITRSVHGVDDLKPGRGYTVIDDLASTSSDLPANYSGDIEKYKAINSGQRDGQPDMLYYNFMGLSGKLIFDKKQTENGIIKGIPLEQTNTQFAYHTDEEEWEVTDSKGWKFYFNVKEMSLDHNSRELYTSPPYEPYGNGTFLYNVDRMDEMPTTILSDIFISSWYLNKIVTPKGDEVVFEYDQDSQHKGISQMSYYEQESYYGNPLIDGGDPFLNKIENLWRGYFSENKYGVTASMQSFDNVNLKKITFSNGHIEFETSDRADLRAQYYLGQYYPKAQKIESFEVFDMSNRSVKRVEFDYSYFNENTTGNNKENYWRLKLDGVQELFYDETSGTYVSKPPYTFNYNSTALPAKTSASIDHWGYYNGADNDHVAGYGDVTMGLYDAEGQYNFPVIVGGSSSDGGGTFKSFMPFQIACGPSSASTRYPFLDGAYREPDAQKMQAAILNQINYPTGGATRFTYSPNEYVPPTDVDFYRYEFNRFSLWHEGFGNADIREFTLNYYTIVKIDCNIANSGPPNELANIEALIEKSTGEDVIRFSPVNSGFRRRVQLILPPGNYRASAKTNASTSIVDINMFVEFVQQFSTDKKIGGGLRLVTQENLNTSGDVVKKRTYDYQNGRAMTEVQHFYKDVGFASDPFSSPGADASAENVIVRSSNTETPLSSSAQGNFVGYSKVSVSDVDLLGNALGKSEYYYTNMPDEKGSGIFNLPGFPVTIHMDNGNLFREIVYNNAGGKVSMKETQFSKDEPTAITVKGIYTRNVLKNPPDASSGWGPLVRFYRIYLEWWHPESEIETIYGVPGENPLVITTLYHYDNPVHKNLTSLEKENSKGQILRSRYAYPPDLINMEQTALMQTLVNQNIISQPVITETFVDDTKTMETHMKFENSARTANITLPVEIHTLNGSGNIDISHQDDLKIVYYKYDTKGNPLEIGRDDDMHIVYIWGYNHQYPIAEIKNATYQEVFAILGQSVIDELNDNPGTDQELRQKLQPLRNHPTLKTASVTTYTYLPLVGKTSTTDPNNISEYYEYDDLGRLKLVRDHHLNIVKQFTYNYKK